MELFLPHIDSLTKAHNVSEYSRRSRLEISPDKNERWHHELHWSYSDGAQVTLTGDHLSGEVFPANPGFELINVQFDLANDRPMIERQPVVGWRAVYDRYYGDGQVEPVGQQLTPLVQHLKADRVDITGVRQPDGRIFSRRQWYANEDAFLEATKSAWLKKKEKLVLEEQHKDCPFCADKRRQANRQLIDDDIPF
jgi:hypothetical protein